MKMTWRSIPLIVVCLSLAVSVGGMPASVAVAKDLDDDKSNSGKGTAPEKSHFVWRQTKASLALLNHGQVVWQQVGQAPA